ncbi:hypothetical protein SDRG_13175, partial [Saprolegnia diclina VS20]
VYHVPFVPSLAALQRDIREALLQILVNTTSLAALDYGSLDLMSSMSPVPKRLDRNTYLCAGGNPVCGEVPSAFNFSIGLSQFAGADTACYSSFNEWVWPSPMQAIFSVIGSGIALDPTTLIPVACAAEAVVPSQCLAFLDSVSTFVSKYFTAKFLESYRAQ